MKKSLFVLMPLACIALNTLAQNAPPTLTCPASATLECTSSNGAPANLTATVSDADNHALTIIWKVDGTAYQTNTIPAGSTEARWSRAEHPHPPSDE